MFDMKVIRLVKTDKFTFEVISIQDHMQILQAENNNVVCKTEKAELSGQVATRQARRSWR